MALINLLDDKTIDKIAAGEVIERPASVVKELVENAIDSGAGAITVEIKEGGISYIRVTDNGSGIDRSEIKKAFLRHATSKIIDVADLFKTITLGFRGEALSSISAVASVELLTKSKNDFSGTRYVISGGREEIFEDAGVPDGTTIIVRNLFYNTPARRKFLKSANTEGSHISELCEKLILSHPEISFKYMINGMDRLVSYGQGEIKDAIYSVFGMDTLKGMIELNLESEFGNICGFIGKPELSRGNRNSELFFVNNRYIKSNMLSLSVENAYKHRLMQHRYPFVILYFSINPERLDINVHPAKAEIKFLDEIALSAYLTDNIERILYDTEMIPEVSAEDKVLKLNSNTEYAIEPPFRSSSENTYEPENKVNTVYPERAETQKNKEIRLNAPEPFETKRIEELKKEDLSFDEIKIVNAKQQSLFQDEFLSEKAAVKHRIIGEVFDTYWLIEYEDSLYIIDQHAAHEKVLYERFIKRFKENKPCIQMISPPDIFSLTIQEEDVLLKYAENLKRMGFEWEHFGGHEYSLSGVPTDLYDLTCRDYFISVIDDLAEGKNQKPDAVNDRIATMACKAAVKGNNHLSHEEAKALIDELLKLENPYNCPHGRPCIIAYSKSEMEKLFKRIV